MSRIYMVKMVGLVVLLAIALTLPSVLPATSSPRTKIEHKIDYKFSPARLLNVAKSGLTQVFY